MHSLTKLYLAYGLMAVLSGVACRKDQDSPVSSPGTGRIAVVKGDNQSGTFGELLADTITLRVSSSRSQDHFKVTASFIQGNGKIEPSWYPANETTLDSAGTISLNWRMGCNNTVQKVRFYVYTDSSGYSFYGQPSDSVTVTANAVKPVGWCRSCGYDRLDDIRRKITEDDNHTLYLTGFGLYSSTDNGLNWEKVNSVPFFDEVMDAQFNSRHWLYVLTRNHGIYYTKDMQQWTAINTGILDMREPTAFLVEDTSLFVSFYFDGPYRSTDNGGFWKKLLTGSGYSQRYYFIRRHPDGRLMLFDDWDNLKVSADNGDSWQLVKLDYRYVDYSVYDFEIGTDGKLYIGSGDATLAILDASTYTGTTHTYYQWNANLQTINNITLRDNDVYYLVNDTPTPGVYSESNGWNRMTTDFTNPIDYYFLRSDQKLLFGSGDWLYYHD